MVLLLITCLAGIVVFAYYNAIIGCDPLANKEVSNSNQVGMLSKRRANQKRTMNYVQSRDTGNIGHTRRSQTKQQHNAVCVGHQYTQTNTSNVNIFILNIFYS